MMKKLLYALALLALSWPVSAQDAESRFTLMSSFDLDGEAADADQIVTAGNGDLTDAKTFTLTADPDVCRLIDMTVTDANSSITAGIVTVAGTDCLGYTVSCTFDFSVVATRGSGVKTLTSNSFGGSCYMATVTSVTTNTLTGEGGAGVDLMTLGYTSNSVNGWAMYGTLMPAGPSGEHGVNPFGSVQIQKKITTSAALSTTVTGVTGADDAFELAAVNDLLLFTVRDSMGQDRAYERRITARASADSITINQAVNIPAEGVNYRLKKRYFSTNPNDLMAVPVAGYSAVAFPWTVTANANTGGVINTLECADHRSPSWPSGPWTQIATTTTASAGTQAWTLGTSTAPYVVDLTLSDFSYCRFAWKFGTGDDADAANEDLSVHVMLTK